MKKRSLGLFLISMSAFGSVGMNAVLAQDKPVYHNFGVTVSNDEQNIIYYSSRETRFPDLIMRDAVDVERNITNTPNQWEIEPAYSPDGKWVAYSAGDSMRDLDIFVMDVESGEAYELVGGTSTQSAAKWHPSGNIILYSQFDMVPGNVVSSLWTVDRFGGSKTQLTGLPDGSSAYASWSPDGSKIIFSNEAPEAEFPQLFIYDMDAKESTQVTTGNYWKGTPVFSNDGHMVYFVGSKGDEAGVYQLSLDGSETVTPVMVSNENNAHFVSVGPQNGHLYFSWGTYATGYEIKIIDPSAATHP